uniref:Uncharacterized protein n=1 Tax=Timema shepardi TaxID=629360 RepID=A0A7R9FXR4_TIMSH|nr:unnamed protein product [Timema shepardi]
MWRIVTQNSASKARYVACDVGRPGNDAHMYIDWETYAVMGIKAMKSFSRPRVSPCLEPPFLPPYPVVGSDSIFYLSSKVVQALNISVPSLYNILDPAKVTLLLRGVLQIAGRWGIKSRLLQFLVSGVRETRRGKNDSKLTSACFFGPIAEVYSFKPGDVDYLGIINSPYTLLHLLLSAATEVVMYNLRAITWSGRQKTMQVRATSAIWPLRTRQTAKNGLRPYQLFRADTASESKPLSANRQRHSSLVWWTLLYVGVRSTPLENETSTASIGLLRTPDGSVDCCEGSLSRTVCVRSLRPIALIGLVGGVVEGGRQIGLNGTIKGLNQDSLGLVIIYRTTVLWSRDAIPDWDSNPDLPVIGILIQHERDALYYAATEAGIPLHFIE